jgi:hypothetical protein
MKTSAMAVAAATLGFAALGGQAQAITAGAVIDITQVGANVVATGSGVIDLSGLTLFESGPLPANGIIWPAVGEVIVGAAASIDDYTGASGPASMGSGVETVGSTASGDQFGVGSPFGSPPGVLIFVPEGYVSGTSLLGSATFDGTTLAALGLTPGTYAYTWSPSPSAADGSLTVVVSSGTVPEPSTWAMMLLGFVGLGFVGYRASRRTAVAA